MKTFLAAASAAVLLSAAGHAAHAAAPIYGFQLSDSSEALSPAELASFLGAPDDLFTGLGGGYITYDFGPYRLVDGAGQDFNVYEVDGGIVEFNLVDILVSLDGLNFWNVEASALAAVDLVGDEAHGSASFRRSYDLADAVANLGVNEFRYLRLDGTGSGGINTSAGFDPDAVAAINYIDTRPPTGAIPEPATWAMMILGFGAAGSVLRRRRTPLTA